MKIKNARVLCDDFQFHLCGVEFDQRISKLDQENAGADANGAYLLPGFFDLHTHGVMGMDCMEVCDTKAYQEEMYKNGVLNFFPTTVAAGIEETKEALRFWSGLPFIRGLHMEGPFLNADRKGAMQARFMADGQLGLLYDFWDASGGKLKLMTLAPEVNCNLELIPKLMELGVRVSLGHTTCDFDFAQAAFDCGADHVTHLFNAMNPLHHRSSGLVGAALDREEVFCEVVADGIHLAPEILRLVYRLKGPERMILISDSTRTAGLPDGRYLQAGKEILVEHGVAKDRSGAIAGSTKNLRQMVRYAVDFGIPLEDAVRMASLTPAQAVGLQDELGSITPGKTADLILTDEALRVKCAWKAGEIVYGTLDGR